MQSLPTVKGNRPQSVRIFLINLDEDKTRLRLMHAELAKLGLSYERFPAYRGSELPPWLKSQFYDGGGKPISPLHPGEIGCYASHLTIWQKIVEEDIEDPVLILEDDVTFEPTLVDVLSNLDRLPADWEIVRCSNPPRSAFVALSPLTADVDVVRYWYIPLNAAGYLIRKAVARRLVTAATRRVRPVDHDMRRFWEIEMNSYGLIPPPIRQKKEASTIDRVSGRARATTRKRFKMSSAERRARLAASLRIHGMKDAARCMLSNGIAYVLRRIGADQAAARVFRVSSRRG